VWRVGVRIIHYLCTANYASRRSYLVVDGVHCFLRSNVLKVSGCTFKTRESPQYRRCGVRGAVR
jgi:hypothetical protein